MRGGNAAVELNVALQVELVGDEVQVAQNLGLAGIALGPLPLSHQLGGKRVPIDMAFRIASRAGIAIPVPGAAHPSTCFQHLHRQTKPITQAEQLVKPGEARANDQRVEFGCLVSFASSEIRHVVHPSLALPGAGVAATRPSRPTIYQRAQLSTLR